MTNPVVLHVVRPYANEEAFIAAEGWTVDARSMLLIDQPELPEGTMITFAVTLGDGSRPIKAEARVTGSVAPSDGRPGGLRVRFKRYGAPTKAFIDRAVAIAIGGADAPPAPASPGDAPEPGAPSVVELSAPDAAPPPPADATRPVDAAPAEPAPAFLQIAAPSLEAPPAPSIVDAPPSSGMATLPGIGEGHFTPVPVSPSGAPSVPLALSRLRARGDQATETPPNRAYLLEKLRQRGVSDDETMRYQPRDNAAEDVTQIYRRE